jgi:hypothetical protein
MRVEELRSRGFVLTPLYAQAARVRAVLAFRAAAG